jgi:galactokinase
MITCSAFAPGRAELLGNHTDYNEGFILALAVEPGITITGRRRGDDTVTLRSGELRAEADLNHLAAERVAGWARYVLGVVDVFRRHGLTVGGFDAEIASNLPMGAGLSSSAALENATGLLLQKLFELELTPLRLAKFSQLAEHDFVGVRCGLMDQATSLLSRRDHAIHLDCRTDAITCVPLGAQAAFVIAQTGVHHALTGGEYNERRADCEAAARALGVPALRDVSPGMLETQRGALAGRVYRRALHVVGENARVAAGAEALRRGDLAAFGALMFESHESSRVHFENSCVELDELVAAARTIPGIYGARLTGGGFGGATINLVERGREEEVAARLARVLPTASCLITRAADGAWALAEKTAPRA